MPSSLGPMPSMGGEMPHQYKVIAAVTPGLFDRNDISRCFNHTQ